MVESLPYRSIRLSKRYAATAENASRIWATARQDVTPFLPRKKVGIRLSGNQEVGIRFSGEQEAAIRIMNISTGRLSAEHRISNVEESA
jgi:hypothetical protein